MAEALGIIAGAVSLAEIGLRLGTKLYTFGVAVAGAQSAVTAISSEVTLTSSVMKELGDMLMEEHDGTGVASEGAIRQTETFISECKELFQKINNALPIKMPNVNTQSDLQPEQTTKREMPWYPSNPKIAEQIYLGNKGISEFECHTPKATSEKPSSLRISKFGKAKWALTGQPKVESFRNDVERMKSSLLILLNVLIYARLRKHNASQQTLGNIKNFVERLSHQTNGLPTIETPSRRTNNTSAFGTTLDKNEMQMADNFFPSLVSWYDIEDDSHNTSIRASHQRQVNALKAQFDRLFNKLLQETWSQIYEIPSTSRSRIASHVNIARSCESNMLEHTCKSSLLFERPVAVIPPSFDNRPQVSNVEEYSKTLERSDLPQLREEFLSGFSLESGASIQLKEKTHSSVSNEGCLPTLNKVEYGHARGRTQFSSPLLKKPQTQLPSVISGEESDESMSSISPFSNVGPKKIRCPYRKCPMRLGDFRDLSELRYHLQSLHQETSDDASAETTRPLKRHSQSPRRYDVQPIQELNFGHSWDTEYHKSEGDLNDKPIYIAHNDTGRDGETSDVVAFSNTESPEETLSSRIPRVDSPRNRVRTPTDIMRERRDREARRREMERIDTEKNRLGDSYQGGSTVQNLSMGVSMGNDSSGNSVIIRESHRRAPHSSGEVRRSGAPPSTPLRSHTSRLRTGSASASTKWTLASGQDVSPGPDDESKGDWPRFQKDVPRAVARESYSSIAKQEHPPRSSVSGIPSASDTSDRGTRRTDTVGAGEARFKTSMYKLEKPAFRVDRLGSREENVVYQAQNNYRTRAHLSAGTEDSFTDLLHKWTK